MPFLGKKIQITTNNFGSMVRKSHLMVDKSLMIKDFIEGEEVSLITRPRRFGKTLNLSMLHHFFAAEIDNEPTQDLFSKLAIAREVDAEGDKYIEKYQGQYPVICISFKDVKESSCQQAIDNIKLLISSLYHDHRACLNSDDLIEDDLIKFKSYLAGASQVELGKALFYLSQLLHKVYKKKVIILIDEYDSPLTSAYEHQYLDALSNFMRDMLSSALKDNRHLEKGLMTGILRVSQSSMLSGLNNLKTYTLLEEKYQQYFGFTEDEVIELMHYLHIDASLEAIRNFYNGYKIGHSIIYNPWSLMNYFSDRALQPYWVLTSNDKLLKDMLLKSSDSTKKQLGQLIIGKAIEAQVKTNLCYDELMEKPETLWTLLLFCGYLKIETSYRQGSTFICQLKVPNEEVLEQYNTVLTEWISEKIGFESYHAFLKDLLEGRIAVFIQKLTAYLLSCASSQDFNNESNYHTFVLGLVSGITATHHVLSNKEAGIGRPDVVLIPKDTKRKQGFILEFKQVDYKKQPKTNRLQLEFLLEDGHDAVIQALNQINSRAYDACFSLYPHITEVIKIGIAFANRFVSAGSITTPIEKIIQTGAVLTDEDITFYDARHDDDTEKNLFS